ncbi:glycoside hydrolase family 3 N-terminal domain-containing protein [Catenuloplanes atrovinosus]|uniref:beta-glucosidase n=1 Tax=Catenuloplanes atrovinosus TaxID=137266 RepID=A0AAE3YYW9_9ACTN|nr:glycoside hydrolase family 3 N-terminal domain-containing protein [Catenuloplanes atrovinosus]MDR7280908.1 beta-glucosidase [Catenuloplanes atrovinosus]
MRLRSLLVRSSTRRRLLAPAVVGVLILTLTATPAGAVGERYLDPKASVPSRVADLLRRMTVEEKVGQLQQIAVNRMQGDCNWSGGALNETCMREVLADQHAGSVLSGGGAAPAVNTPRAWAEMVNTIQRYAIEHSRLRIPIVYGVDAVHGHNNVLGTDVFPHQIGLGATWNTTLNQRTAEATQRAVAATGTTWNFSPVADLARDQRWGRYYETYAEDPVLAGTLAAGAVTGLQNRASGRPVAATVKHFAGYSEPFNGHDRAPADLSPRYLQDTILPPYKAAVDAGALTVMVNSGAVNGIPATGSRWLLTDLLRDEWGFKGVTISDWNDVRLLHTAYHITDSYAGAVAAAVNAGVDMAMVPPDDRGFHQAALDAVNQNLISKRRLDQAVGRILTLKFQLGLFDRPYVDPAAADAAVIQANRPLNRQTATESLVLLRNTDGTLPFGPDTRKIVVAGPNADNLRDQVGGWTIGWQGVPDGVTIPGTTILQGLRDTAPAGTTVVGTSSPDDAVAQAEDADAVVVAVGNRAAAEGEADMPNPVLAPDQQELVARLEATGTPVVVVVVSDRPLVLGPAGESDALIAAWQPGSEGGNAIADVLYGRANPSGRLPVSWPAVVGNQPLYYQQLPGTNAGVNSGYTPAYPFGAGLSYTSFTTGGVALASGTVRPKDNVRVTVTVSNTGGRAGDLVVPVYAGQPVANPLAPPKRLVAFTKVALAAGETRTVTLNFPASRLAVTPGDMLSTQDPRVAPGRYVISAGESSATLTVR